MVRGYEVIEWQAMPPPLALYGTMYEFLFADGSVVIGDSKRLRALLPPMNIDPTSPLAAITTFTERAIAWRLLP